MTSLVLIFKSVTEDTLQCTIIIFKGLFFFEYFTRLAGFLPLSFEDNFDNCFAISSPGAFFYSNKKPPAHKIFRIFTYCEQMRDSDVFVRFGQYACPTRAKARRLCDMILSPGKTGDYQVFFVISADFIPGSGLS